MSIFGASYHSAHAQSTLSAKLAPDLANAIMAPVSLARQLGERDTGNGRFFKVIVVGTGDDPLLADLRKAVAAAGGAVNYRYQSIQGFSATIPGPALNTIALRPDVDSISPNRPATKTASMLELATGAAAARTLAGFAPGYDGRGVGIAILDSGIYSAASRIPRRRRRDAPGRKDGRPDKGERLGERRRSDVDAGPRPQRRLLPRQRRPAQPRDQDRQHRAAATPTSTATAPMVASVAAGRAAAGAPDATGIAPGATLFDVTVLDATGVGSIGDVLAGIDWVIYHSKEYGIRVLNLSLAADSTESFRTDPLCRAARAATAAGLTVVVAAGNYGQNAAGGEQYGTITSPGNDPSVITVGSVNNRDTALRGDDVVNRFSSRGPTFGVWIDAAGKVRHDDLVKPDLVAPGNRVLGALSHA